MGHASEVSQLQSILSIVDGLKETTTPSRPPTHSLAFDSIAVVDSITLPAPPLLPSLLAVGATHEVATAARRTYQLYAEELRQHIRERIIVACHEMVEHPTAPPVPFSDELMKKIVSTAAEVYLRRITHWQDYVVQRVKERSAISTKVTAKNSHGFNHEFVPLLERFFEENPFPTHADKMFLAKKSYMEYRQIHVWFQNRRSRTKREGKLLRKKPVYKRMEPSRKQYECAERYVTSDSLTPETPKVGSSANGTEIAWNNVSKNTLLSSSPPHAFPSPYPPVCHYDPFPCKSGPARFRKLAWRRMFCGKLPPPLSTNIDELVDMFAQLHVRDEMRCKGSSTPLSHAATAAITVIPSRAPHPSLLLREYRQPANTIQHHPIVRASIPSSKVFQISSFVSEPATLIPSVSLGRRKTAPLPRRLPSRTHNTSRNASPSSSPSASPCWLSPDFGTRDCSFASASPLPTLSDIASTQELPHSFGTRYCSPSDNPICPS